MGKAPTILIVAISLCGAISVARANQAIDLFDFDTASGYAPNSGAIAATQGILYGTTPIGGDGPCFGGAGCGTVYALAPPAKAGEPWTMNVLHNFEDGNDGQSPQAPLALGHGDTLYGFSVGSFGTVFDLEPNGSGYTFNVLYTFPDAAGLDLDSIYAPLLAGTRTLYGIANGGSPNCAQYGCGGVFRLQQRQDGTWKEHPLYAFGGNSDGGEPTWIAGPDATGALYVSTRLGNGAVVQVTPPAGGHGNWTEKVISTFSSKLNTPSNLVLGPGGVIYGTAYRSRGGAIFQLTPADNGSWARTIIAIVKDHGSGADSLALEDDGSLLGVIEGDVDFFAGAAFRLTPAADGGAWTFTELRNFNHGPDRNPLNLISGSRGHLYGVTSGGDSSSGAVFEIK